MRNLLGTGRYMTTAFEDLGKPFELENLANGCMAILSDESSVNAYTENCRVFKNLVVGDVINLNVKYRSHVEICFHGLTVFSVNELPHTGDKTRAMEHRLITIPMEKCFTGHDRKYIKADYLNRKEVLEYVMYKVLNMDFYEFSEPDVCKQLKTGYLIENDIIREFAEEILPQLAWDYVPKDFLFDLYKEYIKNNNPSAHPVGKGSFWKRFQQIVEDNHPEWKNHSSSYPTKNFCFDEEPLLEEYHLYEWQHSSGNPKLVNYQKIKSSMACITRAVLRIGRNPFADPDEDEAEDVPFRNEEAGADVPGTAPSDDEEE
jgi:putative DNA primase/helicase